MQQALHGLVEAVSQGASEPVSAIDVMPAQERQQCLVEWNATEAPPMLARSVQALLEDKAAEMPHAVALIEGDVRLTHAALHAQANRLAHHLRSLGVGPDVRVAVCMDRGANLVVSVLAILKAGGAYVPMDPAYPRERLAYMLDDSAPEIGRASCRERV